MTRQELEQIKALILQLSTKISSLPEITTLAGEDLFTIAKSEVGGVYTSKKMKMNVLAKTLKTRYPEINGSRFAGLASPRDEVFTPPTTTSLFWIAYTPGTYSAYGNIVVGDTPLAIVYDITTQQFSSLPLWEASSGTVKFSFANDTIVDNQVISQKIAVSYGNEYDFELNIQPTDSYEKIIVRQYNFNDVMLDVQEYDTIRPKVTPVKNASYIVFAVTYRDDNPVSAQNSYLLLTAPISVLANDVYSYVSVLADKVLPDVWPWEAISGLPTTLEGYGITDAVDTTTFATVLQSYYTKTESDTRFQPAGYYVQRTDLRYLHFVAGAFEADEFIQGITEKTIKVPTATAHLTNNGANGVNPFVTQGDIDTSLVPINALIPNQASSENQLADKAFVNSSIATNTANFKGTYNSVEALANITGADANDYAFVSSVDTAGNTLYSRYKYSSGSWLFEYTLNNSSFTAAQWAAIQSGITSSLVTKLSALPTSTELSDSLNTKVDKVAGKGLSTNDYTTAEKNKLAGIEDGAQVNDIEVIKVGGRTQTITDKTVDLPATADDFTTEDKADQEFFYRQTADGELNWVPSTACVEKLKGKSMVWNQLVQNGDFSAAFSDWQASDGTNARVDETLEFTASSSINNTKGPYKLGMKAIVGHKYYIAFNAKTTNSTAIHITLCNGMGSGTSLWLEITGITTSFTRKSVLWNNTDLTNYQLGFRWLSNNVSEKLYLDNIIMVDLTLMFGSGNEPTTVQEFESMFPLSYYDYSPGTLLSFNGHYLKTVGFNQWDEEWENCYYDESNDGVKVPYGDSLGCKNYIPVIPETTYYLRKPEGTYFYILFYDVNKNYISYRYEPTNNLFATPAGCAYITFYSVSSYGSAYNHDICINLSDPAKNGTYEPYKETLVKTNPTELTSNGVQIFPYGLQSAGNVYDEVTETKAIKRIGRVDLGSLTWDKSNNNVFYAQISDAKGYGTDFIYTLNLTHRNDGTVNMYDKCIAFGYTNRYIYIRDDSNYATLSSSQFATVMSGVYLNYELATPIVYDLDEPLDLKAVVDINGTEQVYPENTSTPYTTPIRADIQYGLKSSQLLTELRIADRLRFERDFTVTDYSGDHSGESAGFDGSEDATLALPEVINGQVERNTEISRTEEFHYQPVPVKHFNDAYKVDKIYGKTLAWNQILYKKNDTVTSYGVTFTPNGDGSYAVSGTASGEAEYYIVAGTTAIIPSGHKVLVRIAGGEGKVGYIGYNASYNTCIQNSLQSGIITISLDLCKIQLRVNSGVTANSSKVFLSVYDLTLMFGAGNEPSTVEEFESLFPLSYYPYDAGSLISNDAESIETVGFNLWDEEWEFGTFNYVTGEKKNASDAFRNKNLIPIFPETQYFFESPISGARFFYDADGNYIGDGETLVAGSVFTTPANARYMNFHVLVATYNHDICINLSDSNFNGQYEPYRKSTLHLGLNNIRVKSHNIWDEEWESGSYDADGQPTLATDRIRTKNPIPVFPGVTYYAKNLVGKQLGLRFYDANDNHISGANAVVGNEIFTTPANAAYLRFSVTNTTTYNNDICINVFSSFNGQYEPHGILTFNGVKSAGSVYDEIVGSKYVKRVGEVDMGTLTWRNTNGSTSSGIRLYDVSINDKYVNRISSRQADLVCHKYVAASDSEVYIGTKSFSIADQYTTDKVMVYDPNHQESSGTSAFTSDVNGVILYYRLATPIEYELAEPMLDSGWIDENGTMRVVYEDESAPHVLFKSDITYGVNAGHIIDKANEIIKSFKEKLETLWDAVFNNS